MTTRRDLLAAAALLGPLAMTMNSARATENDQNGTDSAHGIADFLFVQNAREITYADGTLTLKGVSPATLMFSDRPERIAGHMKTTRFVPFWAEGSDSFLKDPPNATLSFLDDRALEDVVLVLRDPMLTGEDLSYEVTILEGKPPASTGLASLFIDIIGMPMTPVSFAGAGRRAWRRAVIY